MSFILFIGLRSSSTQGDMLTISLPRTIHMSITMLKIIVIDVNLIIFLLIHFLLLT